jgi:hypothetical protein
MILTNRSNRSLISGNKDVISTKKSLVCQEKYGFQATKPAVYFVKGIRFTGHTAITRRSPFFGAMNSSQAMVDDCQNEGEMKPSIY